jgi:hypothetical protein
LLKTGLIVIQNGLYPTLVIAPEGVYIVIARYVYAKMPRRVFMSPTIAETPDTDSKPCLSRKVKTSSVV